MWKGIGKTFGKKGATTGGFKNVSLGVKSPKLSATFQKSALSPTIGNPSLLTGGGKAASTWSKLKTGVSKFAKSDMGKSIGMQALSSMSQPRQDERNPNPASTTFANMKFGTGGSSALTFQEAHNEEIMKKSLKKNRAHQVYTSSTPKMQEYIKSKSPFNSFSQFILQKTIEEQQKKQSPTRNYKKGYYGA